MVVKSTSNSLTDLLSYTLGLACSLLVLVIFEGCVAFLKVPYFCRYPDPDAHSLIKKFVADAPAVKLSCFNYMHEQVILLLFLAAMVVLFTFVWNILIRFAKT